MLAASGDCRSPCGYGMGRRAYAHRLVLRQTVDNADGAAYADAVSEYAALERDELPEAVRAVTSGRG
ncbi:uncharacterized protein SAZU_2400 [Streptomyces azureus]|uniref:Uncharacterized protein n=1 Tax=Streptomyces azureus TaxID=146537 RepID=A0A0K8PIV6_STRAJ|nr:uncharacterized protein SAZU_2400 [Streptomyces azureus]